MNKSPINELDFNLYIIKTIDEDGYQGQYEYSNLTHARETIDILKGSSLAPKNIYLYGYKNNNYYFIECN